LERLPFKADGYSFWTWRGRRIHYVEQGSGQPIVLIHGFGASAFHWRSAYEWPYLLSVGCVAGNHYRNTR
jgi:pimeloyl-ACP methyl ester carboxylesterase